jgi:riboflavin synthase alpha subunit
VTVEGVSLTIAGVDVEGGTFEVALIPTTLEKTTLGSLRPGDRCNLESDVMARTVVHYLRWYGGRDG